ncbi:hypothetical protein J6590_095839 [Homalodisca vitripennis]|nr:hypothetical protein J6590_095839 [Homalodisca vitripennis]
MDHAMLARCAALRAACSFRKKIYSSLKLQPDQAARGDSNSTEWRRSSASRTEPLGVGRPRWHYQVKRGSDWTDLFPPRYSWDLLWILKSRTIDEYSAVKGVNLEVKQTR